MTGLRKSTGLRRAASRIEDVLGLSSSLNAITAITSRYSYYGDKVRSSTPMSYGGMDGVLNDAFGPGYEPNGWHYFASPIGRAAGVFFTRSSDNPSVADMGTYAAGFFTLADGDDYSYGTYTENRRRSWVTSSAHGQEIAVVNEGNTVDTDPYNPYAEGLTDVNRLSTGLVGYAGQTNISAFQHIISVGGAKALKGIVVGSDALVMTNGQGDAFNLARGHNIQWWIAQGVRGPRMRSDATDPTKSHTLIFANDATVIQDASGNDLFSVGPNGITYLGNPLLGRSVELDATYFGLKADGTANNMANFRAWMAAGAAISAAGGRPIMRAAGTFRCTVDTTHGSTYGERKAIRGAALHNAHFDCAAATWMFDSGDINTGYANVVNIEDSDNVSGHLGTVDWLKKPVGQGVITKGADYIDITLDAGFSPAFTEAQRVDVYTRQKVNQNKILSKSFGGGSDIAGWTVTYPSAGVMRVSFAGDATALTYLGTLTNGEIVVATYRVYGADAYRIIRCKNSDLKANVITTGGMALRTNEPENSAFDLTVAAAPTSLISSTADGLHCAAGRGWINLTASAHNTGDDPLNITNDSYVVTSVSTPRTFVISSGYPFVLPRVGDSLSGVNDTGTATALGKVVTINTNTGQILMDTDLPGGFATTWQVVNTSATPQTVLDVFTTKCRGNPRVQTPNISGRIVGVDLTGNFAAEYIPFFTGEGVPANGINLSLDMTRCNTSRLNGGAVVVQAFQIDGGGYADAGAISKPVINAVVRETPNSAVFLAGVSYGCITVVTDRCCTNPDLANFSLADKQIALINCDNINFPSVTELGASAGQIGTSGTATNLRYGSKLNYV